MSENNLTIIDDQKAIEIAEFIDGQSLQKVQDSYCKMTGMAALTFDVYGNMLTKPTGCSEFCKNHMSESAKGYQSCTECGIKAALALKGKREVADIECPAGIEEFLVPVHLDGKMVGLFFGGQVFTEEPTEEKLRAAAERTGIDIEKVRDAYMSIPVVPAENVAKAKRFMRDIANIISEMINGQYMVKDAQEDIERTANMKSEFLANMSHEIRTPMNAVIGMAEVALRENLTDSARAYISQIKNSGTALLGIINDILDFSKIESGKMELVPVEYETMSLVNDISNVLLSKLVDKNVDLIVDADPDMPHFIKGDNNRIKQVLMNLASNAAKFTNEGQVKIVLKHEKLGNNRLMLKISVEDTGIGIRQEDIETIFGSFQQADSKRNRNIEGTGLGLAISKRLVELMGGTIGVASVFGEGSRFSFSVEQEIVEEESGLEIQNKDKICAYGFFAGKYMADQFKADAKKLGMKFVLCEDRSQVVDMKIDDNTFLFIDQSRLDGGIYNFIAANPKLTAVLLMPFGSVQTDTLDNMVLMPKPLYIYNEVQAFNRQTEFTMAVASERSVYDFTAPEAKILIVDDNAINLTVAEGLLDPLKMRLDTALSAKEAIAKIEKNKGYDIVFMDHMMPEMDGIEATKYIRENMPDYKDIIIIALTANSVPSAKNIFTEAGMDAFVAKPIEVRDIVSKIKYYLPKELIKKGAALIKDEEESPKDTANSSIVIGDLDINASLKLLGSEELFFKVLKNYFSVIDKKAATIKDFETQENWPSYTIEVHALKSASRQIGANELADLSYEMEMAGNEKNAELIHATTDRLLKMYMELKEVIAPFCEEEKKDEGPKSEIDAAVLAELLDKLQEAFDCLDMDEMENVYGELSLYKYDDECTELMKQLGEAVDSLDMDMGEEVIQKIKDKT